MNNSRTSSKVLIKDTTNVTQKINNQETNSAETKILKLGTFHSDEVWQGAEKETWIGLFKRNDLFYLKKIKLKIEKVNDVVVDEEGEKTGWQVSANINDKNLVLISGIELKESNINTSFLSEKELIPGENLTLNNINEDYVIVIKGDKKFYSTNSDDYFFENYKVTLKTSKKEQVIFENQKDNVNGTKLIWCGDLDNDSMPDFIFDLSTHENVEDLAVFLSSKSEKGKFVKLIGRFTTVGC